MSRLSAVDRRDGSASGEQLLLDLDAAAVQGVALSGELAGQRDVPLCADFDGFSLHGAALAGDWKRDGGRACVLSCAAGSVSTEHWAYRAFPSRWLTQRKCARISLRFFARGKHLDCRLVELHSPPGSRLCLAPCLNYLHVDGFAYRVA
ncbi:MAG: hypothetical protein ACI89X_003651 [Planctomycetota bacterium]|jgi:hypothetical protein